MYPSAYKGRGSETLFQMKMRIMSRTKDWSKKKNDKEKKETKSVCFKSITLMFL